MNSFLREKENVHSVYDSIADHFSETRYRAWPVVDSFIKKVPFCSVGVDFGCGNGKNMNLNPDSYIIGLDLSLGLLENAKQKNPLNELIHASMISSPMKENSFDFGICIAALHHLASHQRRLQALISMSKSLKKGAKFLIVVWALEQAGSSKKNSLKRHTPIVLDGDEQEVLVPWRSAAGSDEVQMRYYHLFRKNELENLFIESASFSQDSLQSGYDQGNWYVIGEKI